MIADTEFPAFASLCATSALIPVIAHSSDVVMRAEVISCSKRLVVNEWLQVSLGCVQKYQSVDKSKYDICTFRSSSATNLFYCDVYVLYVEKIYSVSVGEC